MVGWGKEEGVVIRKVRALGQILGASGPLRGLGFDGMSWEGTGLEHLCMYWHVSSVLG